MKAPLRQYFIASLPAAFVGVWNLGDHLQSRSAEAAAAWQLDAINRLPIPLGTLPNSFANLVLGVSFLLPLLLTVVLTSRIWAGIFSKVRRRPVDSGWFLSAWLFSLLIPATLPLHYAAIGYSFGAIFGCYVFGGTGRYIVNPALLGVAFLSISYPELFAHDRYLPGSETLSSWALVATEGVETAMTTGVSWVALFSGREIGVLGTASALASLLGAVYLIARRIASIGIVAGALIAIFSTSVLISEIPWAWHLALGNFAFVLAFIATDSTTRPATTVGCWAYGVLFGALIVILRTADPGHPEASVPALLLASLCIPLIDHIANSAAAREKAPEVLSRE
ncbi:MAG: RnfABCDGE type electron transport complex subunit D [Gammaproteobacteria bacterium]